jgi:hypothetical protein
MLITKIGLISLLLPTSSSHVDNRWNGLMLAMVVVINGEGDGIMTLVTTLLTAARACRNGERPANVHATGHAAAVPF